MNESIIWQRRVLRFQPFSKWPSLDGAGRETARPRASAVFKFNYDKTDRKRVNQWGDVGGGGRGGRWVEVRNRCSQ